MLSSESAEREALMDLFNATQGPRWERKGGWGTNAPIAEWYGVRLNNQGRVAELKFSANNLEGSLPESMGTFTCLTMLWAGRNKLSGPVPETLGNLSNLRELSLRGNQISGNLPSSLGNLTNLTYLYLNENQFSGTLPSSLGNLTRLTVLDVSHNQISGELPETLGNLANLRKLSLWDNQFSGEIPETLGSLSKLEGVFLNDNQLSGLVPETLGCLSNLRELCLQSNDFSGKIPVGVLRLKGIEGNTVKLPQGLELPRNIGDIGDDVTRLDLSNMGLRGVIPETLGNLSNLQKLDLSYNKLSGRIPVGVLRLKGIEGKTVKLPQGLELPQNIGDIGDDVTRLDLSNMGLRGGIPETIENLSNLRELSLSGNQLSGPLVAVLKRSKFSATLFRSPEWRKAALEQRLLSRRVPPPKIKVNLCGNAKAGKTQIVQGWLVPASEGWLVPAIEQWLRFFGMHVRAPLVQEDQRTIGMDIHSLQVNGCDMAVWDYGGQQEFSMLHHHYLGSKHAVYLFVSSLVDASRQLKDPTRLATELTYWWRLIVSVGKEGSGEAFAAPMAIILTHIDLVGPGLLNSSTFGTQVIRAALSMGVSWGPGDAPPVFTVNALHADESKAILPWLCQQHRRLQASSDPVPELCVAFQPVLEQMRSDRQFCNMEDLLQRTREMVSEHITKEQLNAVCEWLHIVGEVICCDRLTNSYNALEHQDGVTVFLNPTWLCSTIFGYVASKKALLLDQGCHVPWNDGEYVLDFAALELFAGMACLGVSGNTIALILEHFSLGLISAEKVLVPSRVTIPYTSEQRQRLPQTCVLGRKVRFADPKMAFVPGLLPMLMLAALKRGAALWQHTIVLPLADVHNTVAIIEAVIAPSPAAEDGRPSEHVEALNILVYSNDREGGELAGLLLECERIILQVQQDITGSSKEFIEYAIGPRCIRDAKMLPLHRCCMNFSATHGPGPFCFPCVEEPLTLTERDLHVGHTLLEVQHPSKIDDLPVSEIRASIPAHALFNEELATEYAKHGKSLKEAARLWAAANIDTQQKEETEVQPRLMEEIDTVDRELTERLSTALPATERGRNFRLVEIEYEFCLQQLRALCDPDVQAYGFMYYKIMADCPELEQLLEPFVEDPPSRVLQADKPGVQPNTPNYLCKLFEECEYLLPQFRRFTENLLNSTRQALGDAQVGSLKVAPLKKVARCLEKTRLGYDGDYRLLLDIVRCSFVFDSIPHLIAAVRCLINIAPSTGVNDWRIVRVKNRFAQSYPHVQSGGYRDLLVNVCYTPQGVITEVQFHLRPFFERKQSGGHKLYAFLRSIQERLESKYNKLKRLYEAGAGVEEKKNHQT